MDSGGIHVIKGWLLITNTKSRGKKIKIDLFLGVSSRKAMIGGLCVCVCGVFLVEELALGALLDGFFELRIIYPLMR